MGARGPIPMSNAERIARGARTSGRMRKTWTPPVAIPDPPAEVLADPDAARKWNELADVLAEQRTISVADRAALAVLSVTITRWVRMMEHVRRCGENCPESKIATQLGPHVQALLEKFGLTPAGRRRLHVAEPQRDTADDAAAERLLNK